MGYKKTDLLSVTEQIYNIKEKIQDLNRKLDYEKFHERYMPRKSEVAGRQWGTQVGFVAILGSIIVACIAVIMYCMNNMQPLLGIVLGIASAMMIGCIRLIFLATKEKIGSPLQCQMELERVRSKIALLKEKISDLNFQLEELCQRQDALLAEKNYIQNVLEEKGIILKDAAVDEAVRNKNGLTFSLKEETEGTDDLLELFELYSSEEKLLLQFNDRLQVQIDCYNKDIMGIEDDFSVAKQKIIFCVGLFVLMIIIQSIFVGTTEGISALICILLSVFVLVYIDRSCTQPILLYLIEHESDLTKEYAFCNNIVPIYKKREEVIKSLHENQKELQVIRQKKDALDA